MTEQTNDTPAADGAPSSTEPAPVGFAAVAGLPTPGTPVLETLPDGSLVLEPFVIPYGPGPILLGADPTTGELTAHRSGFSVLWYVVDQLSEPDEVVGTGSTWLAPEWVRGRKCYAVLTPDAVPQP